MIENVLPAVVDSETRVLVVGSMPGVQSLEKQQYYGHPRNHFWPIIAHLTGVDVPERYEGRLALVRAHHIGLWDVIKSCERTGSLDSNIREEVANDFELLFIQFPQIEAVVFNGTKAFSVFKKHIGLDALNGREFYQMPSTSPVPGRFNKTLEEKCEIWAQISKFL
ncbi:MAG: DNA-deoxyinosine glycosylase [Lysinibacillus sp.]